MGDSLYCFFCTSETDYDLDDKYAECVSMSCGAYFHLDVDKGCINNMRVARHPKDCKHE